MLRQSIEDIFLNFNTDRSTSPDGLTERGIWDQASVRRK